MIGRRLSHFEITAPLGAGGIGEVPSGAQIGDALDRPHRRVTIESNIRWDYGRSHFAVSADGRRILVAMPAERELGAPFSVVLGWRAPSPAAP